MVADCTTDQPARNVRSSDSAAARVGSCRRPKSTFNPAIVMGESPCCALEFTPTALEFTRQMTGARCPGPRHQQPASETQPKTARLPGRWNSAPREPDYWN
jgi:hypothetical protein